jgi:hypothetical protein
MQLVDRLSATTGSRPRRVKLVIPCWPDTDLGRRRNQLRN